VLDEPKTACVNVPATVHIDMSLLCKVTVDLTITVPSYFAKKFKTRNKCLSEIKIFFDPEEHPETFLVLTLIDNDQAD